MSNHNKKKASNIVLFSLDEPRYALYLSAVERVIHSVEITPLPKAPDKVLGVINIQGEVIPVIDIRKLFHLPTRDLSLDDQFIIARTSKRLVVLVVDSVAGVSEIANDQLVNAEESLSFAGYLSGVTVFENKIILITDLEKFLSMDEEQVLNKAIKEVAK
ncbi:MAG: chemotaxis protein CheW [Bacteroidetes bacterium HGW-Bacteroidetes-17]|jgi:purine-binding chemotaxis protein CheW|nr:MAG: chemotaxis protein CheW [Bacteroidetes bacterium HGW-Bacteroidetes-17]